MRKSPFNKILIVCIRWRCTWFWSLTDSFCFSSESNQSASTSMWPDRYSASSGFCAYRGSRPSTETLVTLDFIDKGQNVCMLNVKYWIKTARENDRHEPEKKRSKYLTYWSITNWVSIHDLCNRLSGWSSSCLCCSNTQSVNVAFPRDTIPCWPAFRSRPVQ